MRYRDLKLGTKQAFGFGLILIGMAGVAILAIVQMAALRQEINDINQYWLQRAIVSSRLRVNASALRTVQLQHAVATNRRQRQVFADSMQTLIVEILAGADAYQQLVEESRLIPLFSKEEERLTTEAEALWDQYLALTLEYLDLQGQEARDFLYGEMGAVFNDLNIKLERLVALSEESTDAAAQRAETTYHTTKRQIILWLVAAIVLSGFMAAWLARFITTPVRQLVNAARKVADGDFDVHLDSGSKDEIGTLSRSFSWMTRSLDVQQRELRTANADLADKSHSLERQKAEIEQKNQDLEQVVRRLKETQQQLVMKEKMASLGQLTAGIAHEIKNPLNFVNNFAALSVDLADELVEELAANEDRRVADIRDDLQEVLDDLKFNARKINEHGKRADTIVRSMLEHSRSAPVQRQATDLNALVEEYVNLAYHGMRARQPNFQVTIERNYDDAAGPVELVPQEMGRVLLNLLNNAFYAVHERAQAAEDPFEPCVVVRTQRTDGTVNVQVQDNGGGIPEDIKAKIFEPFFTTKPTGAGNTGLGLSLSYDIVTQGHGGTLAIESTEGEGATFSVTLPMKLPR